MNKLKLKTQEPVKLIGEEKVNQLQKMIDDQVKNMLDITRIPAKLIFAGDLDRADSDQLLKQGYKYRAFLSGLDETLKVQEIETFEEIY